MKPAFGNGALLSAYQVGCIFGPTAQVSTASHFSKQHNACWIHSSSVYLSCSPRDSSGSREAHGSPPTEDRHQAPASSPPFPLSLRDAERLHSPFRSSKFHQDVGGAISPLRLSKCIGRGRFL